MENEPIILKSKLKKYTYTMHDDVIMVCFDETTYIIELPKEGKNLSFCSVVNNLDTILC